MTGNDTDPDAISGSLIVDSLTEEVTGANISAGTFGIFDTSDIVPGGQKTLPNGDYQVNFDNTQFEFSLILDTASSLFAGTGASIDSASFFAPPQMGGGTCPGGVDDSGECDGAISGSLKLTATPLPTAMPLFATGLFALGLFGLRRKRNTAPAAV